jgi:hypothetical protein
MKRCLANGCDDESATGEYALLGVVRLDARVGSVYSPDVNRRRKGQMMSTMMRVWWVPKFPCEMFYAEVESVDEARLVLGVLAEYDIFEVEQHVRSDDSNNFGGLEIWYDDDQWWEQWVCPVCHEDIHHCGCEMQPRFRLLAGKPGPCLMRRFGSSVGPYARGEDR